jgi:ribosomal protein L11 methyltransferase
MQRLVIEVADADSDAASALLFEAGVEGIEQQDLPRGSRLIVYGDHALLTSLESLLKEARSRGLDNRHRREPVDDSWQKRWVEAATSHPLTGDVVMLLAGEERPAEARAVLRFEPGWAFGTGGHVTTRLAAEGLADLLRERPGARVLDVGTGSGVLALASLLWGAREVLGLDCDPRAVAAAKRNAALNAFSDRATFEDTALEQVRECFEVVVANIDQPTLLSLVPDLVRVTRTDGELVVTGLLEEHSGELVEAFGQHSATLHSRREREGWSLLRLRHALGKAPQS